MAKLIIELAPTETGHVIGDFTWDFCRKVSDDSVVSTAGCTLVEYGNGSYSLSNPNVTADSAFRLHLTANTTSYASGIFSLADDNTALANADFSSLQKTSLNAATPASVQNIAAQTGDSYARIGAAGAGLTALGDARIANLDAAVSSRLAPSGTLATVTNLTNAPTTGDFTATMKTSLNAATPASVTGSVGSVTAGVTLAASQPNYAPLLASAYTAPANSTITAIQTAVAAIPTTPLLTSDTRLNYLNASVSGVAAAVWDVTTAGHLTSGSTGASLNAAGSSGDPWSTTLPGAYGSGTAGYTLGHLTSPDNTSISAILTLLNSGVYGVAALKTLISAIPTNPLLSSSYTAPDNADIAAVKADVENVTSGLAAIYTKLSALNVDLSPITSRLDNTTYGLAAIEALAAAAAAGATLTPQDLWDYVITNGQSAATLLAALYIPAHTGLIAVIPANTDPTVQFVHFYAKLGDGTVDAGRTVSAVATAGQIQDQNLIDKQKLSLTLDSNGYGHLTLICGIEYRVLASWWGEPFTVTVTADSDRTFAAYVQDLLSGSN